jgi:hypothetical protein
MNAALRSDHDGTDKVPDDLTPPPGKAMRAAIVLGTATTCCQINDY